MNEARKSAFYGGDGDDDDGRPTVFAVLTTLRTLTGSVACASELLAAADYVEALCGPEAALTQMPAWIN
jgi:hypothetical protein